GVRQCLRLPLLPPPRHAGGGDGGTGARGGEGGSQPPRAGGGEPRGGRAQPPSRGSPDGSAGGRRLPEGRAAGERPHALQPRGELRRRRREPPRRGRRRPDHRGFAPQPSRRARGPRGASPLAGRAARLGGTRGMYLEMRVKGVAVAPLSTLPILILRDEEDKRSLPIWVGLAEANAIAHELEKIPTARPMTHDLMKSI